MDLSFDPGFGVNGPVNAVALQPDGKAIIGGQFSTVKGLLRTNLARLNADGSGNATFNPAVGNNPYFLISSLALQTDGKVLVSGQFADSVCDEFGCYGFTELIVRRLNADGSLDNTFNPPTGADNPYGVSSILVQPDGKVLVGGDFSTMNGTNRGGIARLKADGTLDASFNPGTGMSGHEPGVFVVALQSDGKVLIGGAFDSFDGTNRSGVARLNANGTLDASFNPGTGVESYGTVYSVALQPDGKVLIGGSFTAVNGTNRNNIARLNANGSLDSSFNPGTGTAGAVRAVALQPDGKVLIGGEFTSVNGTNRSRIARLNADGSLDSSFNPGTGPNAKVSSIALQPDGKVLIGGDFTTVNGVVRLQVARLYGDFFAPSLSIARSNAFVIVSWPVTGLNFQLQESADLSLPNSWSPVAQPAVTNAGQTSVSVPTTVGRKFFRLKSQ